MALIGALLVWASNCFALWRALGAEKCEGRNLRARTAIIHSILLARVKKRAIMIVTR